MKWIKVNEDRFLWDNSYLFSAEIFHDKNNDEWQIMIIAFNKIIRTTDFFKTKRKAMNYIERELSKIKKELKENFRDVK